MSLRIDPPLDPPLLRSLREYIEEQHPHENEPDAPSLYCPWKPSPNGARLIHGGEPAETDAAWLSYLIELYFACTGRKLTGEVKGITCTDNNITTHN